jgi:hypothetical protein
MIDSKGNKYKKEKDNLGYEEILFCSVIFLLLSLIKFMFFC